MNTLLVSVEGPLHINQENVESLCQVQVGVAVTVLILSGMIRGHAQLHVHLQVVHFAGWVEANPRILAHVRGAKSLETTR